MRVNREEIFGPIATVVRAADADEALALANDTEFGLSAGVCTTSLRHAARFRDGLQAGIVTVNLPTAGRRLPRAVRRHEGLLQRHARAGPLRGRVLHDGQDRLRAAVRAWDVDPLRRPRVACRPS